MDGSNWFEQLNNIKCEIRKIRKLRVSIGLHQTIGVIGVFYTNKTIIIIFFWAIQLLLWWVCGLFLEELEKKQNKTKNKN